MGKDQYILLAGAAYNVGDFLIKYRALRLFGQHRPDRSVKYYTGVKRPLTEEQVAEINDSRALIIVGSAALRSNLWPGVYPLVADLDQIKVPILTAGIGWRDPEGTWQRSCEFGLSENTKALFSCIRESGYRSSVRDYRSLNALLHNGYDNFVMTGCPALYSLDHVGKGRREPGEIRRVSFSTGHTYASSRSVEVIQRECMLRLRDKFAGADFGVVLHNQVSREYMRSTQKASSDHYFEKCHELERWLGTEGFAYKDISSKPDDQDADPSNQRELELVERNVRPMIEHYSSCDLHVGFRVHAHILMNSMSRPSILIAEDGRGRSLHDVIGGTILKSYLGTTKLPRWKKLLAMHVDPLVGNHHLPTDLLLNVEYEMRTGFERSLGTREQIDNHYREMVKFLKQLP